MAEKKTEVLKPAKIADKNDTSAIIADHESRIAKLERFAKGSEPMK